jgi:hypothetical protein
VIIPVYRLLQLEFGQVDGHDQIIRPGR